MPKNHLDLIKLASLCAVLSFACAAALKGVDIYRAPDDIKATQLQVDALQQNCVTNFQQMHYEIREIRLLIEQKTK